LDKPKLQRTDGGLGAASHTEFAKDATEMIANGACTELVPRPDLPIGKSNDEQTQDLQLAWCQRRRWLPRRAPRTLDTAFRAKHLPGELAQLLHMVEELSM